MSIPNCPTHGQPMKVSKFGGFYCTVQNDDESYCKEKVAGPKPTSIAPATNLLPKAASGEVLAAASLEFAAAFWKGAGPEMSDDALALAIKAYSAMRAIL